MLAALLEHELPAGDCIVQGPVDKTAVDACIAAGVGATVELSLGGKMDAVNAAPLAVTREKQIGGSGGSLEPPGPLS
jgi:microcystin degradation protein MlrC